MSPILALLCGVAAAGAFYVVLIRLLNALPPELEATLKDVSARTMQVLRGTFRGSVSPLEG